MGPAKIYLEMSSKSSCSLSFSTTINLLQKGQAVNRIAIEIFR